VHRGVYAVAGRELSREGLWLAAVLAFRRAALSHWDAAELWGIVSPRTSRITHVSVPRQATPKPRPSLRIHRVHLMAEVTRRTGIPVTTPARTLLDLSPSLPRRRLERAIDEASYQRLLRSGALEATIARNARRPGATALGATLVDHTPGATRTRSELEERFLSLCRRHGLPEPAVNRQVAGLEVDFCWPEQRLIVETDGYAAHKTRRAFERDHERDLTLEASGYQVRRFTYRQVTNEAAAVAGAVSRALG
jgi:very-short-patch-repair endonuclease